MDDPHQVFGHLAQNGQPRSMEFNDFMLPYNFLNDGTVAQNGHDQLLDFDPPNMNATGAAHDDSCIDRCSSLGVNNMPQALHHRNGPGPSGPFHPRSRHSVGTLDLSFNPSMYHFGMGQSTQFMDFRGLPELSVQTQGFHEPRDWGSVYNEALPVIPPHSSMPTGDEDNRSVAPSSTTCDSACSLDNPCTGTSCASDKNACTDRNCPDVDIRVSSDVANAAAALTSIGGAPETQQFDYGMSSPVELGDMGMQPSHMPHENGVNSEILPPFSPNQLRNITNHLLLAHSDPGSSDCTTSCPINNPQIYEHCYFLYTQPPAVYPQQMQSDSQQMRTHLHLGGQYLYGLPNHSFDEGLGMEECGVEHRSPHAFIQHFNDQHRQGFAQVSPADLPASQPFQPTTEASSVDIFTTLIQSPPPVEDLFSPNPLSSPQKTEEKSPASAHHRAESKESLPESIQINIGPNLENICLWCQDDGPSICGETLNDPEELFAHVNSVHIKNLGKGRTGFRCSWKDCRREEDGKDGFPQRSKIERHMQTHIGHKPHACIHCGKKFSAKQALNQHLLIHTNEKPLECDWPGCDKTFRQQSALTMHRRTHTGEKPLECDLCGKRFSESSNLSKHKRTHEIKGRFRCTHPGCNRNFHRQDQLRRHAKQHTEKEPSQLAQLAAVEEPKVKMYMAGSMAIRTKRVCPAGSPDGDQLGGNRRKRRVC